MAVHRTFHIQIVVIVFIACCAMDSAAAGTDKPLGDTTVRAPSVQWRHGYGTDSEEHVHEGMQTTDGGYVAVGTTDEKATRATNILVIKIGANGQLEWQKVIGKKGRNDAGQCIAEVPGGYVVGGALSLQGEQQAALLRLDLKGNTTWQRTYAHKGNGAIRGIDITEDGGIVATGYTDSKEKTVPFIADEAKGLIMKTDKDGRVQWKKTLSVTQGTKVRQDRAKRGFVVCSTVWRFNGKDHQDACLLRLNNEGKTLWTRTYGGADNDQCYDLDLTPDHGYVLAGHTISYGRAGGWDAWLVKVGGDGRMQWHKSFGQPLGGDPEQIFDECYGVKTTSDGGFVMACGSGIEPENRTAKDDPRNLWAAYVVRTDARGNLLWEFTYHTPRKGHNAAEYVNVCRDGGYIVFLDSDTEGKPRPNNFGFLKIAPDY